MKIMILLFSFIVHINAQLSLDDIDIKPIMGNFELTGYFGEGECNAIESNSDTLFFNDGSILFASKIINGRIEKLFSINTKGPIQDMIYVNGKLYIIFKYNRSGIQIYSVAKDKFTKLGEVRGYDMSGNPHAHQVTGNDSVAFIAGGEDGLIIVNVKDPSEPEVLKQIRTWSGWGSPNVYSVELNNNNLFIGVNLSPGRIYVFDINNPYNPKEIQYFEFLFPIDLSINGDTLVAVSRIAELSLFDISNPTNITKIDSTDIRDYYFSSVILKDGLIYTSNIQGGVKGHTIDVLNSLSLSKVNSFGYGKISRIKIEGNNLLCANKSNGFKVYDRITGEIIDSISTQGIIDYYEIYDKYYYISFFEKGLSVYTDLYLGPDLVNESNTGYGGHRMAQNKNYILHLTENVSTADAVLINKSNPNTIIDMGKTPFFSIFVGFGNYFIGSNYHGTYLLKIVDKTITTYSIGLNEIKNPKKILTTYPYIIIQDYDGYIKIYLYDENSNATEKYDLINKYYDFTIDDTNLLVTKNDGRELESYTIKHDTLLFNASFDWNGNYRIPKSRPDKFLAKNNTIAISKDGLLFLYRIMENKIKKIGELENAELIKILDDNNYVFYDGLLSKLKLIDNKAPVYNGPFEVSLDEDTKISFTLSATDSENSSISISIRDTSKNIFSFLIDNEITIEPKVDYFGLDSISITISDGIDEIIEFINITVTPVQDSPTSFGWISAASDSINITQSNLTDIFTLKWDKSNDVDGETIDYLLYEKIGVSPSELIYDTTVTTLPITYQEFLENVFEPFPTVSAATVKFSVSATDGKDTVKVTGDDRVLFVNRYDYLSIAAEGIPLEFALHENYPNPFNPTTTLRFDLPEVSDITLTIYNMLGQKVRTFDYQNTSAGYHSVTWDATNDLGQQVGAGVYLYQLQAKDFVKTRKMVLLK